MSLTDIIDRHTPEGYKRSGVWIYKDKDGNGTGAVARFDASGANGAREKTFKPFVAENGKLICKGFPKPWPLYGLDRLAARPDAPVLLCEGEKAADAAAEIFQDFVCVSTMHGAQSAGQADLTPLEGRDVVVWPDKDKAGDDYAKKIVEIMPHARVVHVPDTFDKPGWDLADDMPDGVTDVDLAVLVAEAMSTPPKPNGKAEHMTGAAALAASTSKISIERPWPVLAEAAYHGLAGEIVQTISPHSEADPVALLIQMLTCAGNMVGRRFYYLVEADRHHANLFTVLVGASSKARKGTSHGRILSVAVEADPQWVADRNKGGLSSGEGLINEVRDAVVKWNAKEKQFEEVDPGIVDKRLNVVEAEFASALAVMERAGNTLSPLLRKAWDGGKMNTLTRSSPLEASNAHISIIGHITETELKATLTRTDMANGFANRFLFPLVKRSKLLPFGGGLADAVIQDLGGNLKDVFHRLPEFSPVSMTPATKELWAEVYPRLSADKPGMIGAVTARAEAQAVRLAMIYALLDGRTAIDVAHMKAGLALWDYCDASAARIFGDATGDPVVDEIVRALRAARDGLTRTSISDLFGRNQSADRIGAALADLLQRGVVRSETKATGGRPVETWFAMTK
jgi:hypothetical protein